MLNKTCPHCQSILSIEKLKTNNNHKTYLARKPIPCPDCDQMLVLPAIAEKLVSIGLLFSVILTPLFYYWRGLDTEKAVLSWAFFILGILLIIIGSIKNQAQVYNVNNSVKREENE